jgi:hypothetical protein
MATAIEAATAATEDGATVPCLNYTTEYSTVYEFNIDDLARQDHRWGIVKNHFFVSCTVPTYEHLPRYNRGLFENAKNGRPTRGDSNFELKNKIVSRIRTTFWRYFRCSSFGSAPIPKTRPDWHPNNGKFQRVPGTSQTISAARSMLGSILNEHMDLLSQRGDFYYPEGGYREWHTNRYDPHGWRLYIVHTVPNKCASFQYIDPRTGERLQCIDFDGCMRLFKITGDDDLLWHSITSDGKRWSLGFILSEESAMKLIFLHRQIYVNAIESSDLNVTRNRDENGNENENVDSQSPG